MLALACRADDPEELREVGVAAPEHALARMLRVHCH
jgi:hypothetical protein